MEFEANIKRVMNELQEPTTATTTTQVAPPLPRGIIQIAECVFGEEAEEEKYAAKKEQPNSDPLSLIPSEFNEDDNNLPKELVKKLKSDFSHFYHSFMNPANIKWCADNLKWIRRERVNALHLQMRQYTPNGVKLNQLIEIGPNSTALTVMQLSHVPWDNAMDATFALLLFLFGRHMLATHTVNSDNSLALDRRIVNDIIYVVTRACKAYPYDVQTYIAAKCAIENKMFITRITQSVEQLKSNFLKFVSTFMNAKNFKWSAKFYRNLSCVKRIEAVENKIKEYRQLEFDPERMIEIGPKKSKLSSIMLTYIPWHDFKKATLALLIGCYGQKITISRDVKSLHLLHDIVYLVTRVCKVKPKSVSNFIILKYTDELLKWKEINKATKPTKPTRRHAVIKRNMMSSYELIPTYIIFALFIIYIIYCAVADLLSGAT